MIDFDKTGLLTELGLLAREAEVMKRCPYNSIYAMIDIDLFKRYNTALGYEKADEKLRKLADLFRDLENSVD